MCVSVWSDVVRRCGGKWLLGVAVRAIRAIRDRPGRPERVRGSVQKTALGGMMALWPSQLSTL